MRRVLVVGVVLSGLGWLAGCGDSTTDPAPRPPPPPDPPRPTTVTVSPAEAEIAPGDTLRLAAAALDANGHAVEDAEFAWASSDEAVATVEAPGLVRAAAAGVATITASVGSAEGTAEIMVVEADRAVLVALYEATNGPGWLENAGWLSDRPIGEWHGVTTGPDGRVTALRLSAGNLVGSIPPELASLTGLETLDLERNELAGPIPPELGGLANLRTLILGVNDLAGRIPPELGDLASLEVLRLRRNDLAGPVPPELSRARNLRRLGLERNRLTGAIPPEFLELDGFETLHFETNDGLCVSGSAAFRAWLAELEVYVGPLCDEADRAVLASLYDAAGGAGWTRSDGWLGDGALSGWHGIETDDLGRVTGVDLSGNGLAGGVSGRLAQLTSLTSLRIGGNPDLDGPLPLSLSALSLRELHYAGTGLCTSPDRSFGEWLGAIPSHEGTGTECAALADRDILALLYEATGGARWNSDEHWLSDRPLGEWQGVTTDDDGRVTGLSLGSNNLAGPIPAELGGLSGLRELDLQSNFLAGPVPPELGYLANLEVLNVWDNSLTGPIPPELSRLSGLVTLDLGANDLTGPVPPELGNLSSLTTLTLNSNDLTGPIPPELGGLASLEVLWADRNELTGPIPPELGGLAMLEDLNLGGNELSGGIPPELGRLSSLTWLALGGNGLSGGIPAELGNLAGLERLQLNGNSLSGALPPELGAVAGLREMWLGGNELTGGIPPEWGALTALVNLTLDRNGLTGSIPSELGGLASLELLSLDRNNLTGAPPAELGALANLRSLSISNNALTGQLPDRFRSLSLDVFWWHNNAGLCAPDTTAFRTWLAGIQTHRAGPFCSGSARAP